MGVQGQSHQKYRNLFQEKLRRLANEKFPIVWKMTQTLNEAYSDRIQAIYKK